MKTLIRSILVATVLLSTTNINAQEKKTTFGIKAGLNICNIGSDEGNYDNTKSKVGFLAGITLDYAFTPQWYLLTGLEYTSKGVIVELSPSNQTVTAAYAQLPIQAGYKFSFKEDMAVLFHTGAYVAYGLHGQIKQGSGKQDTFGDYTLKRFDGGVIVGAAFEYKQFRFGLGGEIGVVNIMQDNNDDATTRNMTLTVGYRF